MQIVERLTEAGPVLLRTLLPGAVFKFVNEEDLGGLYHLLIDDHIVELDGLYEKFDRSNYQEDEVIVYNAVLQVSR